MTAINIFDKISELEKGLGRLSEVQKVFLFTDGSVTALLDVLYGKTEIKVLEQKIIKADDKVAQCLQINENDEVNHRIVLIHNNNVPLICAESYTPLERLDENFKKELIASEVAIGRILKMQNIEMRREVLSVSIDNGESVKEIFKNDGLLLNRTYKIINGGKILIWIKEIFSQHIC
ncbi:MAG: chorismate lyase [Endomicrobia bacterium]|nr:chorismate lyase [Endomicrobiia bacterium]